jgi:ATP-dependent protease ClpP protease subunit
MLRKLIILLGILGTTVSAAIPAAKISGFINEKTTRAVTEYLDSGHPQPIIVIDSGGGLVREGLMIQAKIRELQMRGVPVICHVSGEAMSMAFFIWSICEQRSATSSSKLMFHAASLMMPAGRYGLEELENYVEELRNSYKELEEPTVIALRVDVFAYSSMRERVWAPAELKSWAPNFEFKILGD